MFLSCILLSVPLLQAKYLSNTLQIYGIDAASGAAILALDVQPGDHVLDLCAAPGNYFNPLLYITLDQYFLSGKCLINDAPYFNLVSL